MWQEKSDPPFLKAIEPICTSSQLNNRRNLCLLCTSLIKLTIVKKWQRVRILIMRFIFDDAEYDAYYYCVKMEMGHTIYHRFTKEDYQMLVD